MSDHGTSTIDPGAFQGYGGHRIAAFKLAGTDERGTDSITGLPPGQPREADHDLPTRLAPAGAVMIETGH